MPVRVWTQQDVVVRNQHVLELTTAREQRLQASIPGCRYAQRWIAGPIQHAVFGSRPFPGSIGRAIVDQQNSGWPDVLIEKRRQRRPGEADAIAHRADDPVHFTASLPKIHQSRAMDAPVIGRKSNSSTLDHGPASVRVLSRECVSKPHLWRSASSPMYAPYTLVMNVWVSMAPASHPPASLLISGTVTIKDPPGFRTYRQSRSIASASPHPKCSRT